MTQSKHICYLAGGSGIKGGQSLELNGMQFSVMKWEEHLLPQEGSAPFGSSSDNDDVGYFSACAGVSEEFDDANQVLWSCLHCLVFLVKNTLPRCTGCSMKCSLAAASGFVRCSVHVRCSVSDSNVSSWQR